MNYNSLKTFGVHELSFTDDNIDWTQSTDPSLYTTKGLGDQLSAITFKNSGNTSDNVKSVDVHHLHRRISLNPLSVYTPLHAPINILSNTLNPTTTVGSIVDDGDDTVYSIDNIGSKVFLKQKKPTITLTEFHGTNHRTKFFVGIDDIAYRTK